MRKLVIALIAIFIAVGLYVMYSNSCLNWSVEKKQAYEFTLLIRKLAQKPEVFKKLVISAEKNGEEVKKVTIDDLKNWSSYNSLSLKFPEGYCDEHGAFSIQFFRNSKGKIIFFTEISWVMRAGSGSLLPKYLEEREPTYLTEENLNDYILQSIKYARKSI